MLPAENWVMQPVVCRLTYSSSIQALIICLFTGFVEFDIGGILQIVVPITQTNMICTGAEDSLSQCSFDGVDGDPTCTHEDDIILVCTRKQFDVVKVVL